MINTEVIYILAYTTRDFRNFGLHNANELYKYKFTPQDLSLLNSGAIKLIPFDMYNIYTLNSVVLNGKKYNKMENVDIKELEKKTLFTLLKTGILKADLKDEYKNIEIKKLIQIIELENYVGKTFKSVSNDLNIDFGKIQELFNLKQGANSKKIKKDDLTKLSKLLEEV